MSKGLVSLAKLKNSPRRLYFEDIDSKFLGDYYKEDLDTIEKELKALEIIKEIWGDRILDDIEKGFILGNPYTNIPNKEKSDLLKEVLL